MIESGLTLEGIVLAAGASRRAGVFKPTYRLRGRPLVAHAVAGLAPWCARVTVVVGHRGAEVARLVAESVAGQVRVVVNPDHQEGMFTSVRRGFAAAGPAAGIFVLPVDCPFVDDGVYGALARTFADHRGERAVVPAFGERAGHPVLLPAIAARELIGVAPPGWTLRDVVRRLQPLRVAVADAAVLMDLDTPADLAQAASK